MEAQRLVPDLFFSSIKALYEVKASGQHLCIDWKTSNCIAFQIVD